MKKILIALASIASVAGFAQEKSLLWKISGNGLTESSYLYGTVHVTCDATLDEATLDALKKTTQLYLELDMDDPALQTEMMSGMMMKDGVTMSSLVSPEELKNFDNYIN
jgi:uncharacterized protein YbaP (TraB family)